MSAIALACGYGADLLFGDPRRLHPVAGFGRVALTLERACYAPSRGRGVLYAVSLVSSAALAAEFAARAAEHGTRWGRDGVFALVTWAALGGRSLAAEANRLAARLKDDDIVGARTVLPSLCGRDPASLTAVDLSRAAVESVAENTADAVVGALFWGAIAGPAGVVGYRAANTLDAMVGHRDRRYMLFGWAAARLDDAMSWPGARIGAALTVLLAPCVGGSPATAARVVARYGGAHPSPNAGRIEAAFAGALGLRLGGRVAYGGRVELRPLLGDGRNATATDIERAARLAKAVGIAATLLMTGARAAVTATIKRWRS